MNHNITSINKVNEKETKRKELWMKGKMWKFMSG